MVFMPSRDNDPRWSQSMDEKPFIEKKSPSEHPPVYIKGNLVLVQSSVIWQDYQCTSKY